MGEWVLSSNLLQVLKQITKDTILSERPSDFYFGIVSKVDPLEITLDQQIKLPKSFLILTRNVTDYEVEMTVDHMTEKAVGGSGDAMYASHDHQYKGRKKFTVHNALKVGEKVVMISAYGGQRYLVLDRIGG